ncbi:MAG: hypothetical protein SA339_02240 [Methanomassiliicoccus sp.]|nr:hypothetical protein [Methanomassiliicoccus sp.]
MNVLHSPYHSMIEMARSISRSGRTGDKGTKVEAEGVVAEIIGPADQAFTASYGLNYWSLLKGVLNEYVTSRGYQDRFVVKGAPFNWHSTVGARCSAVILRKGFYKGDARVEPELFLEAGMLSIIKPQRFGVACGFHYLPSPEGDSSRFVQGVLSDSTTRAMAWDLSCDGFVNPAFRSGLPAGTWNVNAVLAKMWPEDRLPADLKQNVFRAFDELFPLFDRIVSIPEAPSSN